MSSQASETEVEATIQRRREVARVLFGAYPSRRRDAGEVDAYARHLVSMPLDQLNRAVMDVSQYHPLWPPTAAELIELARKLERARARKPEPPPVEPYETTRLADGNPFEQLARRLESENAAGWKGTPENNAARAAELFVLLGRHTRTVEQATTPRRRVAQAPAPEAATETQPTQAPPNEADCPV